MLKVITVCDEHGLEAVESDTVMLATPGGRVFVFSADPEGGLLVSSGGNTLSVGLFTGDDGRTRTDALVLMAPPATEESPAPKRHLN